jgi:Flp pilus assembly protein TadG
MSTHFRGGLGHLAASARASPLRVRRAGATLVLVAIMVSALIGIAAIAVDLSRLYVMREQLGAAADAAALGGAVELSHQRLDAIVDNTMSYARANRIGGSNAAMSAEDVQVGVWDFDSRSFTPVARGDWRSNPINAVRVTTRHRAALTFGKIFDLADRQLTSSATAAVGYVDDGSCVKPWAIAYGDLTDALSRGRGRGGANLAPGDINAIAYADANRSNAFAISAVEALDFGESYSANVRACSGRYIRAGDAIRDNSAPSNSVQRDTRVALWHYCNEHGGATGTSGSTFFSCLGEPKVKVVLWSSREEHGRRGSRTITYRVKYVGVMRVTGYGGGGGGGSAVRVRGYFSTMAVPGAFETRATPLTRVALVR